MFHWSVQNSWFSFIQCNVRTLNFLLIYCHRTHSQLKAWRWKCWSPTIHRAIKKSKTPWSSAHQIKELAVFTELLLYSFFFLLTRMEILTFKQKMKCSRRCGLVITIIAPMHDYVRRVNFTNKPRLWTKSCAFALFVRGYSFQLYYYYPSHLQNLFLF